MEGRPRKVRSKFSLDRSSGSTIRNNNPNLAKTLAATANGVSRSKQALHVLNEIGICDLASTPSGQDHLGDRSGFVRT
jgi:hypothetical protein